jgi:hypothetical protein
MAIILDGINPTLFNFFSGLISVVSQALLIQAVRLVYGIVVQWHVSMRQKQQANTLPVTMLGSIPPNFVGAVLDIFLKHLQVSLPTIFLVLLFAASDFSDSSARLGISFVPTIQQGPLDSVMTLEYEVRESSRKGRKVNEILRIAQCL